ncbi:Fic family protein [Pedobacter lithocola]|uniref:Fic family protein n=1 Tax=Pedobacter lithocola TaxID=1908239 RepID=A0ABV8P8R4_9SPHI
MFDELQIIPVELLKEYCSQVDDDLQTKFDNLQDAEISTREFSFYTSVSSVYSSKIEGEDIELDSYIKHKKFGIEFLPDYTKKIDDLYAAYDFVRDNFLDQENLSTVHKLLSKHIVAKNYQGKFRNSNMYVSTPDGRIEYFAISPYKLHEEMDKFYNDLAIILSLKLNIKEVFFFASMIHLVFIKIHPFNDGNGRMGRLIEKWFLGQKLGEKSWFLQSEKMYYDNHLKYYKNLRALGLEYEELDYKKALPFLLMLPKSF